MVEQEPAVRSFYSKVVANNLLMREELARRGDSLKTNINVAILFCLRRLLVF
jgi:hypothetical protein